jgi:leucyl-tRNA synthetase
MVQMRRVKRIGLALGAAALLGLASPSATAESATWDQAKVTAIAKELADAVKDLKDVVRQNPDQVSGPQRRAQYAAREDLRLLSNTTRHLAMELERGEGREATLPVYRRVQTLRRDAEEDGRKAMIQTSTMEKIAVAEEILARLAPYYAEE